MPPPISAVPKRPPRRTPRKPTPIDRPLSPKDITPIVINEKVVEMDAPEDDIIVSRQKKVIDPEPLDNDIIIPRQVKQPVTPDSDDEGDIIPALPSDSESEDEPEIVQSRVASPPPPYDKHFPEPEPVRPVPQFSPAPPPPLPQAPPTARVFPATPPPTSLRAQTQHRVFRPHTLPDYAFFTEKTAVSNLTPHDYYTSASYFRDKCARIFKLLPRVSPPEIKDDEIPSMARQKYMQYKRRADIAKTAMYIGSFVFIVIGLIEYALTKFAKIKVQGLFKLQYQNAEEYYDALIEMGETVVGWFQGGWGPMWRMLIMFSMSLIVLLGANYIVDWLIPASSNPMMRTMYEQNKQSGIKWVQEMMLVFMGMKQFDSEKEEDNNIGSTILNMFNQFMGGGGGNNSAGSKFYNE